MAETPLRIEHRDHVVILENQDPPRNRMTFEYMGALEQVIIAIRSDHSVRGFDARRVDELKRSGLSDPKQLAFAVLIVGSAPMMLRDKTVVITGVGVGLGRECVTSALRRTPE